MDGVDNGDDGDEIHKWDGISIEVEQAGYLCYYY